MKKYIASVAIALAAMAAIIMPAQAGSFSGGGRSFSAPSASRSIGVSRPAISAPRATTPTVAPTAPAMSTPPRAAVAPAAVPAATSSRTTINNYGSQGATGGSGASNFLAAAGGGFVGSALGNIMTTPHAPAVVATPAGIGGPAGAGAVAAAPAAVAPQGVAYAAAPQGRSWTGYIFDAIFFIIAACMLAGLIYLIYRTVTRMRQAKMVEDHTSLPFAPAAVFMSVQRAFAGRDEQALRRLLGPNIIDQAMADLPEEPHQCTVRDIKFEVVDVSGSVISIEFSAVDTQHDTKLRELWHFVKSDGVWKLDGVEDLVS